MGAAIKEAKNLWNLLSDVKSVLLGSEFHFIW